MKFLTILFLKFLLSSNFLMAETIPTKSKILKQSSDCLKDSGTQVCKELKLNKDEIISEAKTKLIEDKYLANTNSARENKIFGSPSFVVKNEIFWGDDRMEDAIKFFKK